MSSPGGTLGEPNPSDAEEPEEYNLCEYLV